MAVETQRAGVARTSRAAPGVRFNHVSIRVRDLEASLRWYDQAFGAGEVWRANRDDGTPQLVYIEFAPGQFIELFPNGTDRVPQPDDAVGYGHLCFTVDNLNVTLAHLATLGVQPTTGPRTGRAGQQLAFVNDPDGHRIELMEIPAESPIYRR